MALLCLAEGLDDLKTRIDRIVIGSDRSNEPVTAAQIGITGALVALLKDAIKPNLVQTIEGTPAILHGGPFANIAHGCNSVLATRMALKLGDICVTEAGFGADLGRGKFLDIKMRQAKMRPDLAVLVATIRALKMHGGVDLADLKEENVTAVKHGFANLERHAQNLRKFGLPVVVAINRFATDTDAEIATLTDLCEQDHLPVALADVWGKGGAGPKTSPASSPTRSRTNPPTSIRSTRTAPASKARSKRSPSASTGRPASSSPPGQRRASPTLPSAATASSLSASPRPSTPSPTMPRSAAPQRGTRSPSGT
jgi:formyltetrahydrofolate synthetase